MIQLSEIELIFDKVLILPDKPVEQIGSIYTGEPKLPNTGEVVAIGKGIQAPNTGVWVEMQVSIGDRVVFDRFATSPFQDTEYLILEQGFIKSKIK